MLAWSMGPLLTERGARVAVAVDVGGSSSLAGMHIWNE